GEPFQHLHVVEAPGRPESCGYLVDGRLVDDAAHGDPGEAPNLVVGRCGVPVNLDGRHYWGGGRSRPAEQNQSEYDPHQAVSRRSADLDRGADIGAAVIVILQVVAYLSL